MDSQALQSAWDANHQQLCGYLTSLTHDVEAAQDIAQEAYVRLAREIDRGRAPDNPRAWLYQVARNLLVSDGRRRQVAERYLPALRPDLATGSAEDEVLLREKHRLVRSMLAQLDAIDRRALLMAAQGYSGAEISAAVGTSEGAVRTRLCRARMRLRALLVSVL